MQRLPSRQPAQSGFSLVEVMVALVVGILVLMGVITVYLSGARTSATTEALSRVQESGRFGMLFLADDIRQAGFKGSCQAEINNLLNEAHASYDEQLFDLDDPITGWDDTAGALAAILPGYIRGDVLILKSAPMATGLKANGNVPATSAAIPLNAPSGIDAGQIVLVGDSQGCDLFQKGNAANANSLQRPAAGTPGNKVPNTEWSHAYDEETLQIYLFSSTAYYIGNGLDGQPALRRVSFDTGVAVDEELVNGVEDMQLLYGEDTDGDRTADQYVTAAAVTDWDDVVAIQVNLLVASLATNVIDVPQALPAPWDGMADPGDNRIRRVFTTTVGIRNRLP